MCEEHSFIICTGFILCLYVFFAQVKNLILFQLKNSCSTLLPDNLTKEKFMTDMPKVGQFCWNELATSNVKAAKDFYGKVFNWEFKDYGMGGATYTMVKQDGKEFAGMWSIPKEKEDEIPPHWMSYILVENIEEALKKAQTHGATIIKPTAKAGEFGLFAILKDPTGAHIALWQSFQK